MIVTYGNIPKEAPKGMGARVIFPVLARMDQATGDGRLLESAGAGTRDLPLSIRGQFTSGSGHDGAVVTGALFEVTFDSDTGIVSGAGYLLDDENGRRHATYIATGAMRGNSVDLADVTARFEMGDDEDERDMLIRFTNWNLAATTGVGTPAFAEAHASIDEEMVASVILNDETLVHQHDFVDFTVAVPEMEIAEVTADLAAVPYELFFRSETDRPQKIVVDGNGHVYGHLGLWDSCHDGIEGQCVRIPRPIDGYASFNKPGVLTDRGIVATGPIFAYGGHRPGKGVQDMDAAYGGIENAWADVRISEGRLGPWISGVVRPSVDDVTVYAARASRISGHWIQGRLKAVVSVNAEGFDVPGDQFGEDLAAGFAFRTSDDGVFELVASFPTCVASADETVISTSIVETFDDSMNDFVVEQWDFQGIDDMDLTPPAGARREAERGLEWRREYGRGGTGVGVARARDISRGAQLSPSTVNRMVSYFARHEVDKQGEGWSPSQDGYPSAGRIAWALWGGDAGRSWANRMQRTMRSRQEQGSDQTDLPSDDVVQILNARKMLVKLLVDDEDEVE